MSKVRQISPSEAYEALKSEGDSALIDVRTLPEWTFVGLPNLNDLDKDVHRISWLLYPAMELNKEFINQLAEAIPDKEASIMFICKGGGRSENAAQAASNAGYVNCHNIVGGFEGDATEQGQRGLMTGWKADGLPWFQN